MRANKPRLKKVLLINPLGTDSEVLGPPLGLAYLVGYARPLFPDCHFKIFDFDVNKTSIADQLNTVRSENPDIIGITATTLSITGALKLAQLIKRDNDNIPIFLGGSHVSAAPDYDYPYIINTAVPGEGEQAFADLLRIYEFGKNYPRLHRTGYLKDIDFLPAWDLIDFQKYVGFNPVKFKPQTTVLWSRGCPFNCVFCSNCVWKNSIPRVRFRSPQKIVDELQLLNKNYNIREVFVADDEANTDPQWLAKVCDEIVRRGLKIAWKCQMRVNKILTPPYLFKKMREAGCWHIAWGIESGKNSVLKGINKMIKIDEVTEALHLSKKAGLKNMGLFMLGNIWEDEKGGLAGETLSDCQETLTFAKKLRDHNLLDYVNFNIATPYPGSRMWSIVKKFNLMKIKNFDKWSTQNMDFHGTPFNHPYLSEKELLSLHRKAWATFALNPLLIFRHIVNIRGFNDFKKLFNSARIIFRVILTGHPR